MNSNLITVIIPAYNAEKTIDRALLSLERQTCKRFHCVIVNDGSTDRTIEVLERLIPKLSFGVQLINKENEGVVSARYSALQKVDTGFVLELDADDELTENAVENYYAIWENLSEREQEDFIGICGLSYDYSKKIVCGGKFPGDINTCSLKKYMKFRFKGERICCTRTEYFRKKYEFGVLLGRQLRKEKIGKRVAEGIMHIEIERKKRLYCVNEVFRIYHTEVAESISNSGLSLEKCRESYFSHKYILNHFYPSKDMPFFDQFRSSIYLVKFGLLQKFQLPRIYKDVNTFQKKVVLTFALPFGIGNYLLGRKITR